MGLPPNCSLVSILAAVLGMGRCHLGNQDLVAGLHAGRYPLALLVECSGANGKYLGFVQLLDGRVGEENAGCSLGLGLEALDEDAVEEGSEGLD